MPSPPDGAKLKFEKMDSDKDGYLTKGEFEAGHRELRKKSS